MSIVDRQFRFLYAILFAAFAVFGTSMTIVGATLPRILSDFGWGYTTAGSVIAAGAIGYFSGAFIFGKLIARIGARMNLLLGLSLAVVGLFLFASVPSAPFNFLLNLAIGLGQGAIEVSVNMAVLRMDKKGSGRAMNLMHGAFAIGAVAGPFLIGLILHTGLVWTLVYRGIAVLFALIVLVLAVSPFHLLGSFAPGEKGMKRPSLFGRLLYWLGFVSLFLYVGMELGVSNWIAEYFVKVFGTESATGSFMVSLFWGGILAGRAGVPLLYKGTRNGFLLVLFSGIAFVSVSLIALSGFLMLPQAFAAIMVALAGFGCSIIYPTVMTLVGEAFPDAQNDVIGFAATGGGIGAFVFPFLMSAVSDALGIRIGFSIYALFGLLTLGAGIMLVLSRRQTRRV